jgi:D-aminopeptidase
VAGIRVGNAHDARIASGVTAIVIDERNVASCVTRGGAPGTRDTTLLEPEMTVTGIDAVVLGGGSLFGLDAAGGAVGYLRQQGRGLKLGSTNIPVAVQAIVFDLANGGDKDWGRMPPYWELGWQATAAASAAPFELGSAGGGFGATTATLKGGLGSASVTTASGFTVGAIAVVNAVGSATPRTSPRRPSSWTSRAARPSPPPSRSWPPTPSSPRLRPSASR